MDISTFFRVFVIASLACAWLVLTPDFLFAKILPNDLRSTKASSSGENETKTNEENSGQTQNPVIIVGGRTLTGPNSSARQREGRLFLPVVSIARALGDVVSVDAAARTISVRRQTGMTADFNAQLGQVSENGSVVLVVSNRAEIVFYPNAEELMLLVEIVSQLLDVSIRFDESAKAVIIMRGQLQAEIVRDGERHAFAEIYQADYDYNLSRYTSLINQNLTLHAVGRIADGRFSFISNLSGASARQLGFRNGSLVYERVGGQKFIGGDFGIGTNLQFLSSNARGALAQMPIGGFRLTAFAGRAASGVILPTSELPERDELPQPELKQNGLNFDTNLFGVYATTDSSASSANASLRLNPLVFSAGVMSFGGAHRNGEIASGSVQYFQRRVRLQGDVGIGKFSGIGRDDSRINGLGAVVDFSGSFQLRDNLSVQARFTRITANFLSPQSGLQQPINLKAGSVSWQPKQWLSTSLSASTATRPGNNPQRDNFVTATLGFTPRGTRLPTIFFSHTESNSAQIKNASFTLLNGSKNFAGWRLFMNATRIKTVGAASMNMQFGSNIRLNESNSLEVNQLIGSGGLLSGLADWRTSNLFNRRLSLSAGLGYTKSSSSSVAMSERLTASLRLPRRHALQISYLQTNAGPTLLVSLRGTLFQKREASIALNAPASEIKSYGAFSGRVYQDVNLNGKFEAGIDLPQGNVQVRVDGNRYVVSDADGLFRIDGVKVGEHKIYMDLLSVRADLTLLDGAQQNVRLFPGRDLEVDFRLVRTGSIRGIIWLDTNENGKFDETEQPLSDVRVVAGGGRDTLTDANGSFVIGDLPPGEYVILIDEKTLPEKTKSVVATQAIKVFAGRETGDMNLPVIFIPPETKRFNASTSNNPER